jgi:hypothetical protein
VIDILRPADVVEDRPAEDEEAAVDPQLESAMWWIGDRPVVAPPDDVERVAGRTDRNAATCPV